MRQKFGKLKEPVEKLRSMPFLLQVGDYTNVR